MNERDLTLVDVAQRLGVHYMTAYRYVRTGRLVAHQRGSQWFVREEELVRFEESSRADAERPRAPRPRARRSPDDRLSARLIAGDEGGSGASAQEFQVSGATPREVYVDLFAPAMRSIGDRWADGDISVTDEHRASVVMYRLVGRMGPQFRPLGPRAATLIVGAPAGEMHGLPVALVADLLRAEGFDVIDLGADVPADAFAACASATEGVAAVVISVTAAQHRGSTATLVARLRDEGLSAPIVVGGAALNERAAEDIGADGWAPDVASLVALLRGD